MFSAYSVFRVFHHCQPTEEHLPRRSILKPFRVDLSNLVQSNCADSLQGRLLAEVDGQQTAQLMFVTGTDAGGLTHDHWQDNLAFQAQLHDRLNSTYPGIMRPMSIRASRFNQHIRKGSMLVEVGACGNTLEEALAAARIFANTLADALLEQ